VSVELLETPVGRVVAVDIPIDTIANARAALERIVIVATGALAALEAGVAEYGDAEVLRGIGQLFSAISSSM
jgi:hypothetical protein